ncbi:efflux RND transporter periplasmic adaptor subunit [Elizabethkingia sp. JS20170427COW]|uniref:efflux RND transporter periplasmic adaptor subunit n=1 Tax=Elizabethkingia sp. JS20170427COW TaxID=2583851 RepID=UPI001110094C|nr:efflux RND transporter periplasmic adaptor subunit [Elizabethkingia sp. JS20170427COW]QCX54353.1 efflux RND transporter periplasmic adaptor subunit [Elizabethkingia sp. JS20170427COW]
MKKIIWIIAGIAIVGLVIFKLTSNKKTTESKVYQYDKEKPISVDVDTIRLRSLNEETTYTGTFEPNKETKVSAETQGKINTVLVDVGSYVQQGQTLIQLDNSLLKLQLQSVEVQIEGLHDDVKRYTILTEADAVQGVQLEKAKLGLKSAKVQKATLQEQINKTTIKAPFSGVVTAKLSEIGAFAAPGVPLLQITDISILKFTVNVPESNLKQFQSNQSYNISADVFPELSLNGKLSMIGSKANMGNSFPVQFQVENTKQSTIKSGMFGKVSLSENEVKQGIIIPSSAIINNENQAQVYIVQNGKSVLQTITISKNIGNKTIVSSGLNVGDIIVTNGFINLFDGANVKVKN